jgi:Na+/melibiose symporter-like transporter
LEVIQDKYSNEAEARDCVNLTNNFHVMMKNETLAIILIKMCICNLSNRTLNNVEVIFFNIDSYGVREVITITEEISSILKLENTF